MKIRTKLLINIFLPALTALIIIGIMLFTLEHLGEAQAKRDTAAALLADIFDLSQRTDYYLLYREERAKTEWYSVYDSMFARAKSADFKDNEQNEALRRIRDNLDEMRRLFTARIKSQTSRGPDNQEKLDRLSGLILVRARNISADAFRLFEMARGERDRHIRRANIVTLSLLVGSVLVSLGTLLPVNRTIARSIARLHAGVEIIGAGNLTHKIGLRSDDELGKLSQSFDAMTDRLRIVTISKDELERTVHERTEALQRQADLLELAHSAILVKDNHNRITFWNHAAEEMYGWTKAEALGKSTQTLLKAQFPVSYDQYMTALIRDGGWEGELVHTTKDNRQLTVLSRQAVRREGAEGALTIMEINLDITEARRTEQQLRQAQKMEALGTLAGGIAHDFNNILAAIIGFSELAADHLPGQSRERGYLERVLQAGIRGRDLVRQMLTFSRRTEGEKKPLQLSSIVKETAKLMRASIPSTISMQVNVLSESGVILGTPVEIEQVVMNLGMNAAHAMRETGGVLEIELSDFSVAPTNGNPDGIEPGLYMRLVVRDTGAGIPQDIVNKVFDPFFTTKKQGEGTGLGLSVVLGIVKQSHGYITVQSEPGKGSIFTVYFPKVDQEPIAMPIIGQEVVSTGNERILFVDDEEALVAMGEAVLAELGYQVTSRTNSREAVALVRQDPSAFDLVITDQTMPEMTGLDVAKEIFAIRPDLPVILTTGFSHLVDSESARVAGIKGFIMKPLTKMEIAKTIRKVLE